MISLIVAVSRNNVIGAKGALPWRLSADLQRFKSLTMGKPVVMGRRTNESIGRDLPGRRNIVITRRDGYAMPGCEIVSSPAAAIDAAGNSAEIMVIGGEEVYRQFLPKASRIYRTLVLTNSRGDAFFPDLDPLDWETLVSETHAADERNDFDTVFSVLERKPRGSNS